MTAKSFIGNLVFVVHMFQWIQSCGLFDRCYFAIQHGISVRGGAAAAEPMRWRLKVCVFHIVLLFSLYYLPLVSAHAFFFSFPASGDPLPCHLFHMILTSNENVYCVWRKWFHPLEDNTTSFLYCISFRLSPLLWTCAPIQSTVLAVSLFMSIRVYVSGSFPLSSYYLCMTHFLLPFLSRFHSVAPSVWDALCLWCHGDIPPWMKDDQSSSLLLYIIVTWHAICNVCFPFQGPFSSFWFFLLPSLSVTHMLPH